LNFQLQGHTKLVINVSNAGLKQKINKLHTTLNKVPYDIFFYGAIKGIVRFGSVCYFLWQISRIDCKFILLHNKKKKARNINKKNNNTVTPMIFVELPKC